MDRHSNSPIEKQVNPFRETSLTNILKTRLLKNEVHLLVFAGMLGARVVLAARAFAALVLRRRRRRLRPRRRRFRLPVLPVLGEVVETRHVFVHLETYRGPVFIVRSNLSTSIVSRAWVVGVDGVSVLVTVIGLAILVTGVQVAVIVSVDLGGGHVVTFFSPSGSFESVFERWYLILEGIVLRV